MPGLLPTHSTHRSIIQDRGLRRVNEKIHCKALTADSGTRKMPYIDIFVSFALVVFNFNGTGISEQLLCAIAGGGVVN